MNPPPFRRGEKVEFVAKGGRVFRLTVLKVRPSGRWPILARGKRGDGSTWRKWFRADDLMRP
jgi:hypothetical protein